MELVDTHCHLDFEKYDADRKEVVRRAAEAGVRRIIVPGLDIPSSNAAVDLADTYDEVFAAVGFHPNSIGPDPDPVKTTLRALKKLAEHPKVVAIGEIGLDYYWDKTPKDIQHRWLRDQLALAAEVGKPVILHNREATTDILEILAEWVDDGLPSELIGRAGVLHSFSATWEDAQRALQMGFYVGFTGPLTFKKADEMRRVAANADKDRILVETDGPFLTPHPHRGKRNEPAYVRFVAEKLAEVRGIPVEDTACITTANASRLFWLEEY